MTLYKRKTKKQHHMLSVVCLPGICCSLFLSLVKKLNVLPRSVLAISVRADAVVSAVTELARCIVTSYSGLGAD